ncbi:MAG: cereblon family protein [Desulfobacteraceae bacterium]|jgi:hypothetical protein
MIITPTRLFRPDKCKKCEGGKTKYITTTRPLESQAGEGGFLVCRACMRVITSEGEKIEMNGAHAHGFTNPHGMFFDVGCFRAAPGCAYSKQSSYEFSWFNGYVWRIAVCRTCFTHLGWLFTSGASRFNGLILDKLLPWNFSDTNPS